MDAETQSQTLFRESKFEVSTESLTLKLGEYCGKEGEKIVGVRGHEGHQHKGGQDN